MVYEERWEIIDKEAKPTSEIKLRLQKSIEGLMDDYGWNVEVVKEALKKIADEL